MANELEKAITVKESIDRIDRGELLLPAIQRRFVWNTTQIEFLFDSIMQDYPINTFMFWEVISDEIKNNFRFYDFLKKYIEYNGGNNDERSTKAYPNFNAVIDGQQRLNSLYIGLKGSFANRKYKKYKKKYQKDEYNFPSRKLFLDILNPIIDDDEKKVYDFRFLIHNEHKKENNEIQKDILDEQGNKAKQVCYWFEVGDILKFKNEHSVITYLSSNNLDIGGFPGETLLKLFKLINEKPIINYFLEKDQKFDKVLFEFIRTNSGGTKLSFADLLMSIITASWEKGESTKGAREEIDALVRHVNEIGFEIDQDFILKTCLVLFSNDIRFSLKNFQKETISEIKEEWGKVTTSIKASFELVKSLSFNNFSLRSKRAVIPIIYYLYYTGYLNDINKENRHVENRTIIRRYLHLSLLNKLFGYSSDGFQKTIRQVIQLNLNGSFPLTKLAEHFKGKSKSFIMDDNRIDEVLRTSYDSLDSFYVLSLLFPKFNFEFKNPNIDHLHPKSQFHNTDYSTMKDEDVDFYQNHYNTVLNLALLSEEQNKSKNKSALNGWVEEQEKYNNGIRNQLLIPEKVDLAFDNFKTFIEERESVLKKIIKTNIE